MFPNYPNPFNPITTIQFFLPQKENLSLNVHNILGEEVATVYKGELNSGLHTFEFDGNNISSGIYFIRLETAMHNKTMKAILLK